MKILWVGDAVIMSGFSIVTHNICNRLANYCDLTVYGIGYNGMAKRSYTYFIYPAYQNGDIYGFKNINNVIEEEKPDVIVFFNDDNIVYSYFNVVESTGARRVVFFPVNLLPIHSDYILTFSESRFNTSVVMTYTDFSKSKVLDISNVLPVESVYHGVDHDKFYPLDNVKKDLGLSDYFIVGNINTNTYRKRLDLFLKGFAEFAHGKDFVKCLIHASNRDQAYNIAISAKNLGIADKLLFSKSRVDTDKLNLFYNLMDVNCNTSLGEGFGLSLIEGAACKVPVLCPNHGNLNDIWQKGAHFIKTQKRTESVFGTNFEGDVIDIDDFVSKLNFLYRNEEARLQLAEDAYEYSLNTKFSWDEITDKIYKILLYAYNDKVDLLS